MFDEKGRYILENYNQKSTFSSFLPGISGKLGIPIWSFYVNRGQGITSFGVQDKNHLIMEFFPAHQAYQLTSTLGFRTFLKINHEYYEPFCNDIETGNMYIGMNELEVEEKSKVHRIQTNVLYFTLPGEELGGLVRKVSITNQSNEILNIELLDGMPAIIPYGVDLNSIKTMGQTVKAWMQVEDVERMTPYYRVRVSMEDSAKVSQVDGGNYYITVGEDGKKLPVIVDPEVIFEHNTALTLASSFVDEDLDELYTKTQVKQNNMPCAFFGKCFSLQPGESYTIYGLIGQTARKEILHKLLEKCCSKEYFEQKYKEAVALTRDVTKVIKTKTASPIFDAYCEQTYLDNVLRGGFPIKLGKEHIFYLYSRKHGDIERDYNFFRMLPEFYSQGNGNFRDVNQNRRSDTLFTPYVKDFNIKTFYNLIQLDGYNPLSVQEISYALKSEKVEDILAYVEEQGRIILLDFLKQDYTPGCLLGFLIKSQLKLSIPIEEFMNKAVEYSISKINAEFGEGYWTDHWTYNLDLIECYLAIYPDKERELLFTDSTYEYFESKALIRPRRERYVLTENGVRQYNAVDHETKKEVKHTRVRTKYGKGEMYQSNLMTKLLILAINKFATLDPYGMGIEMEGGKPGWYDALNGLPGIFGSSMAETYELERMIKFIIQELEKYSLEIEIPHEVDTFIRLVNENLEDYNHNRLDHFTYWNNTNEVKENYRVLTKWGVEGENCNLECNYLIHILENWCQFIREGIKKAIEYGDGICPTYFAYSLNEFDKKDDKIIPKDFKVIVMPYFLEGPVRFLKMDHEINVKREMYNKVNSSSLYDKKLGMYKVNESLSETSFEVGRAKAFTPGWLENESIWLHMEYKYLLEVLKSGLYEEFFADLYTTCIPFLDPEVYGRSPLENSSFIASSANPNDRIHGKGFVARLSGSTAEFIHMWQIMMFGKTPFTMYENELSLKFEPAIPQYLIDGEKKIECTFLGRVNVTYQLEKEVEFIPDRYNINSYKLTYQDGSIQTVNDNILVGKIAEDIRDGAVQSIDVEIQ